MSLMINDEEALRITERQKLRRIFSPVKTEEEELRKLMNYEINQKMRNADIVRCINHVTFDQRRRSFENSREKEPQENIQSY